MGAVLESFAGFRFHCKQRPSPRLVLQLRWVILRAVEENMLGSCAANKHWERTRTRKRSGSARKERHSRTYLISLAATSLR